MERKPGERAEPKDGEGGGGVRGSAKMWDISLALPEVFAGDVAVTRVALRTLVRGNTAQGQRVRGS